MNLPSFSSARLGACLLGGALSLAVLSAVPAQAQIKTNAPATVHLGSRPNDPVLLDQPSDGIGNIVSQDFPDFPDFSTYSSDDVHVPGSGWHITGATIYGTEVGDPSQNTAVAYGFGTSPDVSSVFTSVLGTEDGSGNLVFTDAIDLPAGDYWIFGAVQREFTTGGQWYWNTANSFAPNGSEAYVDNPGGGFGAGTSPVPISTFTGVPADLAFTLYGTPLQSVPEPGSVALLASGLLSLGALRLRRRK